MRTKLPASVTNPDPPFTARQLAKRYDVAIVTIWRWRREGKMPDAIRLSSGLCRWTADVIYAWEASLPRVGDQPFDSAKQKHATKRERELSGGDAA